MEVWTNLRAIGVVAIGTGEPTLHVNDTGVVSKPSEALTEQSADPVPYWDPDVPTVVDLLAWEDKALDLPDLSAADGRLA